MIEKIKEEQYSIVAPQLFHYIKRICSVLPCPECSQHATTFLNKVNFNLIHNKTEFRNLFYIFHNVVNKRKEKPLFHVNNLSKYSNPNENIIKIYNDFVSVYQTKGNMRLIADSFQRKMVLMEFKTWFVTNIKYFI